MSAGIAITPSPAPYMVPQYNAQSFPFSRLSFNPSTNLWGAPSVGKYQPYGWAYQTMPYLELNNTWIVGHDSSATSGDTQAQAVLSTTAKFLTCPSRRGPTQSFAMDYAGNSGFDLYTGGQLDPTSRRQGGFMASIEQVGNSYIQNPSLKISSIKRGTSNTLMIAEKWVPVAQQDGSANGDNMGAYLGETFDALRLTNNQPHSDVIGTLTSTVNPYQDFGSAHIGSMNALYFDGSVRQITYSVDPNAFKAISDRTNQTAVNVDDL